MDKLDAILNFLYTEEKIIVEMRFSLIIAIGAIFIIILPNILFNQKKDEYDEIIEKYSKQSVKKV